MVKCQPTTWSLLCKVNIRCNFILSYLLDVLMVHFSMYNHTLSNQFTTVLFPIYLWQSSHARLLWIPVLLFLLVMSQALVQSIHNVYTPEKTFPRREVRPLEERVFQNALDTAEWLDHVRSVVVQVPQFAVVSLMRPPERILFQNLTTTTHSALSCRNSASLTGHTYRQKTSNVTEDFTRLHKCSLHENSTYTQCNV